MIANVTALLQWPNDIDVDNLAFNNVLYLYTVKGCTSETVDEKIVIIVMKLNMNEKNCISLKLKMDLFVVNVVSIFELILTVISDGVLLTN